MNNHEIVFKGCWMWVNGTRFQRYPFTTKEEVFEMLNNWNNGCSIKRIEKLYKFQKTRFQQLRRALGIPLSRGGSQIRGSKLEERKKFVLNVLEDVKTMMVKDVARKHNCTESVILNIKHNPTSRKILSKS